MARTLEKGLTIDVAKCPRLDDGAYVLQRYVDNVDYCDSVTEQWIWSIGKHRLSGRILAATDARYYENPNYECLWLR
jgi:hypothetical protein